MTNTPLVFDVYAIRSPELKPFVQYILFNFSAQESCRSSVVSFANNNICLGILRDKMLQRRNDGAKTTTSRRGIHSYISGMYLPPHRFESEGTLDEICIDFTPEGYYRFFPFPLKTYLLGEDILSEAFGCSAQDYFAQVFEQPVFSERGRLTELFLLRFLKTVSRVPPLLHNSLSVINSYRGKLTLGELSQQTGFSERTLNRSFHDYFDLTAKDYIRILRFRNALKQLRFSANKSFTTIGLECGYYDQSHFIREIRFFTGKSPGKLATALYDIQQEVIIGLD